MNQKPADLQPERSDERDSLDVEGVPHLCVDLEQPWEVRHWCKQFGCTEQQLRNAVTSVGSVAANVKRALVSV